MDYPPVCDLTMVSIVPRYASTTSRQLYGPHDNQLPENSARLNSGTMASCNAIIKLTVLGKHIKWIIVPHQ